MRFLRREPKANKESQQALSEAQENLDRVRSRSKEVHKVSQASKELRERNHFAEQLTEIMFGVKMGGRPQ